MLFLSISACKKDSSDNTDLVLKDSTPFVLETGDFPEPILPTDNPLTVQGVKLGRMLFYEKSLSRDGSISCASCHNQENAFTDDRTFSKGVDGFDTHRHSMTIFNMAWNKKGFFWDGRAEALREQALMPIQDSVEMDETLENVIAKLNEKQLYRDQFARAFGGNITTEKLSLALEQFMLSIVSTESKYDKYLRGDATLTSSENRGRRLFELEYNPYFPDQSGADCFHCHFPKNFGGQDFRNNGLESEATMTDYGRELVNNNIDDRGKMKIPSLRNVELTAPYMHDGRFNTLEEVLDHYNSGVQLSPTLSPDMAYSQPTGLFLDDKDKTDIIAFLKTLTDQSITSNPDYSNPF